jgi:hypothetical protein
VPSVERRVVAVVPAEIHQPPECSIDWKLEVITDSVFDGDKRVRDTVVRCGCSDSFLRLDLLQPADVPGVHRICKGLLIG